MKFCKKFNMGNRYNNITILIYTEHKLVIFYFIYYINKRNLIINLIHVRNMNELCLLF